MSEAMAGCAHSVVYLRARDDGDGHFSDVWRCRDCSSQFVPFAHLESARAELDSHLREHGRGQDETLWIRGAVAAREACVRELARSGALMLSMVTAQDVLGRIDLTKMMPSTLKAKP